MVEIVPRHGLKDFNIKSSEVAAHFEQVVNSRIALAVANFQKLGSFFNHTLRWSLNIEV